MNFGEDFIRKHIIEDLQKNNMSSIHTRFPPEPNGYLHIGHVKSITLNFGIIEELKELGYSKNTCNLRFDDTNPEKESQEYIDAIKQDLHWLEVDWQDREFYASDYFEKMYQLAIVLINKGLAYVDHSSPEEIKNMRGTPTSAGTESKYRTRSIKENLELFENMKYEKEGACLLRAKIDMAHPNIVMRDPPIYRIRDIMHHRTANQWRIYPMYDYAHCLSDALEHITHSLCTLEFEIHRPLYDWFIQNLDFPQPHPLQIEFSRLNISYTVLSKRKMKKLVDSKLVDAWDDPRMPTISGLRRRGYTASSLKNFCKEIGVTKTNSIIDYARLEQTLRQELNKSATRVMTVLDPVTLIIDNYPEGQTEDFIVDNNPENPSDGTHSITFSKHLYIERNDIMENPPKGYFRLALDKEVRLNYTYYVTCTKIIKDNDGRIIEVHANYDPKSKGGQTPDARKVKGTIHWVSAQHSFDIEVHMLDVLFTDVNPDQYGDEFLSYVNEKSLTKISGAKTELFTKELIKKYLHQYRSQNQNWQNAQKDNGNSIKLLPLQFLRKGYFMLDFMYTTDENNAVFNSTVSLKESFKLKT